MEPIFLERTLEITDALGGSIQIKLQFGEPYMLSESNSSLLWRCPFRIIGIGSERIHAGSGIDAIDALLVSLKLAESLLEYYGRRYKSKITWLGEEHLGLSTPEWNDLSESVDLPDSNQQKVFDRMLEDFFKDFK